MEDKLFDFTCEIVSSVCSSEDEDSFVSYGIRAVAASGKTIYEFADISPDRAKIERFAAMLNAKSTPITHIHYAVMDFLQAM